MRRHEEALCARLLAGLAELPGVSVYGPEKASDRAAVVLFNIRGMDPSEAALRLDREYDVCVRCGLHCAPLAHQTVGTAPEGGVRMSMGPLNTEKDIDGALDAVRALSLSVQN